MIIKDEREREKERDSFASKYSTQFFCLSVRIRRERRRGGGGKFFREEKLDGWKVIHQFPLFTSPLSLSFIYFFVLSLTVWNLIFYIYLFILFFSFFLACISVCVCVRLFVCLFVGREIMERSVFCGKYSVCVCVCVCVCLEMVSVCGRSR